MARKGWAKLFETKNPSLLPYFLPYFLVCLLTSIFPDFLTSGLPYFLTSLLPSLLPYVLTFLLPSLSCWNLTCLSWDHKTKPSENCLSELLRSWPEDIEVSVEMLPPIVFWFLFPDDWLLQDWYDDGKASNYQTPLTWNRSKAKIPGISVLTPETYSGCVACASKYRWPATATG